MQRASDVSVVAGGWSVSAVDFSRVPGTVIAVNDSAVFLPRCDAIVSMDRLWTEYRWKWLREHRIPAHIRRAALQNLDGPWPWLSAFDCDHTSTGFTMQAGVLNGTNSGFCALNLAYQMRPDRLWLFGFDMRRGPNGEGHWHPPYPWTKPHGATTDGKFKVWSRQFEAAAKAFRSIGCEVFNVSPSSAVTAFRKIGPDDLPRREAA